jgi:hypothetical protein
MSTNTSSYFSKINDLYNKKGFLDRYGLDIWTAVIISLVFFLITSYFYVLNNIQPIKADWERQKCSPAVMPFAGLINKGPNDTVFDFTGKNFTHCVQGILTNAIAYAFQPIYYIMKNLTSVFTELTSGINSVRAVFDKIRNTIKDFSTEVMGRSLNITMPLVQFFITIKSMSEKVVGILTASLYTLIGSYLSLQSFFLVILKFINIIIIALMAIIAGLIVANVFAFGALSPVIAINTIILGLITVPMFFIKIFISNVLDLSINSSESSPRCFSKSTKLEVLNPSSGHYNDPYINDPYIKKNINNIEIGDILKHGGTVTAIMKFSSDSQTLYNIKGTIVTGEHRIFHNKLGWIKVKEHPERILLSSYNESFVYCLGTDTKTFTIENNLGEKQVFSDWDDIDEKVMDSLKSKCNTLPKNFTHQDIHTYLDNGLIGSSFIELKNGKHVLIKTIRVNDILSNGERVLGIIKIDATNLHGFYEYGYNNRSVCGFNISLANEIDTNEIDTNKIDTNEIVNEIDLTGEKYLYQLLTDTGKFTVNGIEIRDYNYGIDRYL